VSIITERKIEMNNWKFRTSIKGFVASLLLLGVIGFANSAHATTGCGPTVQQVVYEFGSLNVIDTGFNSASYTCFLSGVTGQYGYLEHTQGGDYYVTGQNTNMSIVCFEPSGPFCNFVGRTLDTQEPACTYVDLSEPNSADTVVFTPVPADTPVAYPVLADPCYGVNSNGTIGWIEGFAATGVPVNTSTDSVGPELIASSPDSGAYWTVSDCTYSANSDVGIIGAPISENQAGTYNLPNNSICGLEAIDASMEPGQAWGETYSYNEGTNTLTGTLVIYCAGNSCPAVTLFCMSMVGPLGCPASCPNNCWVNGQCDPSRCYE
jgi:hypothetical protein